MGSARSKRRPGLTGLAMFAALGMIVLAVSSALAYGSSGWTPQSGQGRGGMMGGWGHRGRAHSASPSHGYHGMMPNLSGYRSPGQADIGEQGCPRWGVGSALAPGDTCATPSGG